MLTWRFFIRSVNRPLAKKPFRKASFLVRAGRILGRSLRDEDTTNGQSLEREVAGLSPVDGGEEIERGLAVRVFAGQADLGDDGAGVLGLDPLGEPVGLGGVAGVSEERVNIEEPGAGEHPLVADVAVELGPEVLVQLDLDVRLGGEIGVPPLGGDRLVFLAVEKEDRLAQASAGGDDGDISSLPSRGPRVQDVLLGQTQVQRPISRRLQVVEQCGLAGADGFRERLFLERPGEVSGLNTAIHDRSGDSEAGGLGLRARRGVEEVREDLLERGVGPARERGLSDRFQAVAPGLEEGEHGLRSADVAGQDHGRLSSEDCGKVVEGPSPATGSNRSADEFEVRTNGQE